jgi:hypothetical protein
MRREGRRHVRRQDSPDPDTVTKPTTTADNTRKIKPSSATEPTPTAPIIGVRNDGQHLTRIKVELPDSLYNTHRRPTFTKRLVQWARKPHFGSSPGR